MNNDIILSIYYTTYIDPQRNNYKKKNDFRIISEIYNSVIKNDMKMIIFYDSLDDNFINKYTNKNITFIDFLPYITKYNYDMTSMNDIRFLIYRDYLLENPIYNKVLITDLFDEIFYDNIFNQILTNDYIYANYDRNRNYEHYYIIDRINKTYKENKFIEYKNNRIIQASMFAGYYDVIVNFLNFVKHEFDCEIIDKKYNNNYIVLNFVFYRYFNNKIIFAKSGSSFKTKCGKEILFGTWKNI